MPLSRSINTCTIPAPHHTTDIMDRLHKCKLARIFLLALFLTLLFLAPFISASMRPSYLFFLLNLLIVVIGADAGFLSAISKPRDERNNTARIDVPMIMEKPIPATDIKMETNTFAVSTMKRCKSRPSLFFIGESEEEEEEEEEAEAAAAAVVKKKGANVDEINGEVMSKQELYMKAEMFIGNFYKQLKMQRENSWQKLHGLCN